MNDSINRRRFLASSSAATVALGSGSIISTTPDRAKSATSATGEIRVACIGLRGKGGHHLNGLESVDGVKVVALCDVDESILKSRAEGLASRSDGRKVKLFTDYRTYLGKQRKEGPSATGNPNEYERFNAGVRSRNPDDLGVEIEEGHYSSALCHLGNIAYRLGRTVNFDPVEETFDDDEANAMLSRDYREPFAVPEI